MRCLAWELAGLWVELALSFEMEAFCRASSPSVFLMSLGVLSEDPKS